MMMLMDSSASSRGIHTKRDSCLSENKVNPQTLLKDQLSKPTPISYASLELFRLERGKVLGKSRYFKPLEM